MGEIASEPDRAQRAAAYGRAIPPSRMIGGKPQNREFVVRLVVRLVANGTGTCERELLCLERGNGAASRARHIAMYLLHTSLGLTYQEVAMCFGRDRTTIAHACSRIENLRDTPRFEETISRMESLLEMVATLVLAAPARTDV